MLKFRTTNIFLVAALLILVVVFFFHHFHLFYFLIPATIYLILLFYGSFHVRSGFYMDIICSGNFHNNEIAITFDDGPQNNITPAVLDVLNKNNIKAGFFCIGKKITGNEDIIKRIVNQGHLIGNHTWSHSVFIDFYSAKRILREIKQTEDLIFKITNQRTKFFRPPYGVTNPSVRKAVEIGKYRAVGWNVRSLDTHHWKKPGRIVNRVIKKLKPGSIILFHDTNSDSPVILEKFIRYVLSKGFTIVQLDKLIETN
ncbi:MAG: polysaccharide deacetylase family protein [Bacteroidia bacterium]|nr:polysaccharide deacetylase family protein [Bacteroidia bacterium]